MDYVKAGRCTCIICKKEYSAKGIYTHVDRSHLHLPKYSSGNNGKYDEISANAKKKNERRIVDYNLGPTLCEQCLEPIPYLNRKGKYCSHTCSAIASNTNRQPRSLESRLKTSVTLKKNRFECRCKRCNKLFVSLVEETEYCSKKCRNQRKAKKRRKPNPNLEQYRRYCGFRFNLKDYPDEFDFSLLKEYGMYKPKNKGDNLGGVSRDHLISIRYGFDNNIDTEIMSHPANCRLLIHSNNISKGTRCDLTIEELLDRIRQWNEKYKH